MKYQTLISGQKIRKKYFDMSVATTFTLHAKD